MLFSCKITHSVISYLDRRGEELEALYEKCDWPVEFLRDPSSWLEADKMESILRQIERDYGRGLTDASGEDSLITAVGHQCKDLRAWGVLDSVLRMVQTPKDLFAQPERFLSYFVTPAPPVGEIRRGSESVSFALPVLETQYPLVVGYLRSALEGLPTYINKPMATVRWEDSRVSISWSENQASLFGETQNTELSLHPELVRSILLNLESSQSELEEMKRQLLARDQDIERLKAQLAAEARSEGGEASRTRALPKAPLAGAENRSSTTDHVPIERPMEQVLHELYRLGDYFARGQQLITLLVGQGRKTPQVQEAMRRVDWEHVVLEGPKLVKQLVKTVQDVQESIKCGAEMAEVRGARVSSDLNELVNRAIDSVKDRFGPLQGHVQIDSHLLLDRPVPVHPTRIEQALVSVLSSTVEALSTGGVVRVVTRPRGPRAQIEVTGVEAAPTSSVDTAEGLLFVESESDAFGHGVGHGLTAAQTIVRLHDGSFIVSGKPGSGATVVIELPLEMPLTN